MANICDEDVQYCDRVCIGCGRTCQPIIGCVCTNPLCIGGCSNEFCQSGCTPALPVCDVVSGLEGFFDELESSFNAVSSKVVQLTEVVDELTESVLNETLKKTFLVDGFEDFVGAFDDFGDVVNDITEFLEDDLVIGLLENFVTIGSSFSDVISAIGSVNFNMEDLFSRTDEKRVVNEFIEAADTVFTWLLQNLAVPAPGVFRSDVSDCWWKSLNDGTTAWNLGMSTDPGLAFSISFSGGRPLRCFLAKLRLFSSALAQTEPEVFPGLDPIIALRETIVALQLAIGSVPSIDPDNRPSWCDSSFLVDIDIPDTPYDWLDAFTNGIEEINYITGKDGAIGSVIGAVKSIICDAASVPDEIERFAEGLLESLESRRSFSPSAVVNRLFNAISIVGNKFDNELENFDAGVANTTDDESENCFYQHWVGGNITLSFGISMGVGVFPPQLANINAGFQCYSTECWGCVLGLNKLVTLAGGKRMLLEVNDAQNLRAGGSISFLTSDYSNSGLNECTEYLCDNGEWNEDICTCLCSTETDIWTPQYGCFDKEQYDNGEAPDGAKPEANPNNPNYDSTLDPYSSDYDQSKDTDPYYNPFEQPNTTPHLLPFLLLLWLTIISQT